MFRGTASPMDFERPGSQWSVPIDARGTSNNDSDGHHNKRSPNQQPPPPLGSTPAAPPSTLGGLIGSRPDPSSTVFAFSLPPALSAAARSSSSSLTSSSSSHSSSLRLHPPSSSSLSPNSRRLIRTPRRPPTARASTKTGRGGGGGGGGSEDSDSDAASSSLSPTTGNARKRKKKMEAPSPDTTTTQRRDRGGLNYDYLDDNDDADDDGGGGGGKWQRRRHHHRGNDAGIDTTRRALLLPYMISGYIQMLFSLFVLGSMLYVGVQFVLTVRHDLDMKADEYSIDIMQQVTECSKNYIENRCDPSTRTQYVAKACAGWELCMQRDPREIGRLQVGAETLAEILNKLVEPLSYKTMLFGTCLVVGAVVLSSSALSLVRSRGAGGIAVGVGHVGQAAHVPVVPVGQMHHHQLGYSYHHYPPPPSQPGPSPPSLSSSALGMGSHWPSAGYAPSPVRYPPQEAWLNQLPPRLVEVQYSTKDTTDSPISVRPEDVVHWPEFATNAAQFTFQSANTNIYYTPLLCPSMDPLWAAFSETEISAGWANSMLPYLKVLQQADPTTPANLSLQLTREVRLLTGAKVDIMVDQRQVTLNGMTAMNYLIPIEVKTPSVLPHTQVPLHEMYATHLAQHNAQHAFQPSPGCIMPIFQLMGYMVLTERRYGILTTFECTYFVERDPATPGVLRVSDPVLQTDGAPLTLNRAFAYMMSLAMGNGGQDGYSPAVDPNVGSLQPSTGGTTASPSQMYPSTGTGSYPSTGICGRGLFSLPTAEETTPANIPKTSQFTPVAMDSVVFHAILGHGLHGTVAACTYQGIPRAIKTVERKYRFNTNAINLEARVYDHLAALQGIHVPRVIAKISLLSYTLLGIIMDRGAEVAWDDLAECRAAKASLKSIHKYGVLHGDVRAENFIALPAGDASSTALAPPRRVVCVDFGRSTFRPSREETTAELKALKLCFRCTGV
ncbi:hypothetical protein HDU88_006673 [Geranomyces variabilis]|nr:hypothetical protein HDU88_006673 [Geranomyces variabilis]